MPGSQGLPEAQGWGGPGPWPDHRRPARGEDTGLGKKWGQPLRAPRPWGVCLWDEEALPLPLSLLGTRSPSTLNAPTPRVVGPMARPGLAVCSSRVSEGNQGWRQVRLLLNEPPPTSQGNLGGPLACQQPQLELGGTVLSQYHPPPQFLGPGPGCGGDSGGFDKGQEGFTGHGGTFSDRLGFLLWPDAPIPHQSLPSDLGELLGGAS